MENCYLSVSHSITIKFFVCNFKFSSKICSFLLTIPKLIWNVSLWFVMSKFSFCWCSSVILVECYLQIPHLRPAEYKRSRLSRNRRTVSRAYGGVLSGGAVRERLVFFFSFGHETFPPTFIPTLCSVLLLWSGCVFFIL